MNILNLLLDYDSKEREHLKTLLAEKNRNSRQQKMAISKKVAQLEHYFFVEEF